MDDLDAGFQSSGSGWRAAASGFREHHYWVPVRRATVGRSAAWRATLDAPGVYRIKVKIPRRNATTRAAAYRIKTVDGFVRRVRDQWQRRGDWVGLGIHRLGSQAVVRLTDKTGERGSSGRRVAFDAVKFIPVDGTARAARTRDPAGGEPRAAGPRERVPADSPQDGEAQLSPAGKRQDGDLLETLIEPTASAVPLPSPAPATPPPTPPPEPSPGPTPIDETGGPSG